MLDRASCVMGGRTVSAWHRFGYPNAEEARRIVSTCSPVRRAVDLDVGETDRMSNALTYDLMLESTGILRSHDLRIGLDRDLVTGETIAYHGRRWLVIVVESARANAGIDRRAIARELPEIDYD